MAQGFPMVTGGDPSQGPYPAYTQPSQTYDVSEVNAPGNPYAGRYVARREVIAGFGGRDPRAYNPTEKAMAEYVQQLPRLFERLFQQQGYRWSSSTQITPAEYQIWQKAADQLQKLLQARATEEYKNLATQQSAAEKAWEADRKQYNATYWKTHPTEQDLARQRQNQIAASEKAYSQAQTAADKRLAMTKDPMTGAYMMPDEKKPGSFRPMTPTEVQATHDQYARDYYKQFAAAYGVPIKENPAEAFNKKIMALTDLVRKNPDMTIAQLAKTIENNFAGGQEQTAALQYLQKINPTLAKGLARWDSSDGTAKPVGDAKLKDVALKLYDPTAKEETNVPMLREAKPMGMLNRGLAEAGNFLFGSPRSDSQLKADASAGIPGREWKPNAEANAMVDAMLGIGGAGMAGGSGSEAERQALEKIGAVTTNKNFADYLDDAGKAIKDMFTGAWHTLAPDPQERAAIESGAVGMALFPAPTGQAPAPVEGTASAFTAPGSLSDLLAPIFRGQRPAPDESWQPAPYVAPTPEQEYMARANMVSSAIPGRDGSILQDALNNFSVIDAAPPVDYEAISAL